MNIHVPIAIHYGCTLGYAGLCCVAAAASAAGSSSQLSAISVEPSRSLAAKWLQSFYEYDANSNVNKMEIYANYLNALSKIGHTQVPDMREMIIAMR